MNITQEQREEALNFFKTHINIDVAKLKNGLSDTYRKSLETLEVAVYEFDKARKSSGTTTTATFTQHMLCKEFLRYARIEAFPAELPLYMRAAGQFLES